MDVKLKFEGQPGAGKTVVSNFLWKSLIEMGFSLAAGSEDDSFSITNAVPTVKMLEARSVDGNRNPDLKLFVGAYVECENGEIGGPIFKQPNGSFTLGEQFVVWNEDGSTLSKGYRVKRIVAPPEPTIVLPDPEPIEPLIAYLRRQWEWSLRTFGPGFRTAGIIQHIGKELKEVEKDPFDLMEWLDIVILALDGYWRHGGSPERALMILQFKQNKNFARNWPDWRSLPESQAIEHDRSEEKSEASLDLN